MKQAPGGGKGGDTKDGLMTSAQSKVVSEVEKVGTLG